MITKQEIMDHLQRFGVTSESELEVHSSLSSFGIVDGGAETVLML